MQITFEGVHGNNEVYLDCLKSICGDTEGKTLLDAMCNLAPHTPLLGFKERTYVDVLPRILDHKDEQQHFIQKDIFHFLDDEDIYFDTIICSDGIEHIIKEDGHRLLYEFLLKSDRNIIFTPLGNHMVEDGDNPENHHSGWFPEELKGYASIVFPQYHPTLGIGAFFSWDCDNIEDDFERVKNELKQKTWAKDFFS